MGDCTPIRSMIGKRIAEARANLGLSQADLAQKTGFGKTRISNWETGFRSPKLEESKILERCLGVPAPYLLGLTHRIEMDHSASPSFSTPAFPLIPIYTEQDIAGLLQATRSQDLSKDMVSTATEKRTHHPTYDNQGLHSQSAPIPPYHGQYLPLMHHQQNLVKKRAFAFQLLDNSMAPEYRKQDIIVCDPTTKPRHNDSVLAFIYDSHDVVFRKYFVDTSDSQHQTIQLIPSHPDWFSYTVNTPDNLVILGVKTDTQRIFS